MKTLYSKKKLDMMYDHYHEEKLRLYRTLDNEKYGYCELDEDGNICQYIYDGAYSVEELYRMINDVVENAEAIKRAIAAHKEIKEEIEAIDNILRQINFILSMGAPNADAVIKFNKLYNEFK